MKIQGPCGPLETILSFPDLSLSLSQTECRALENAVSLMKGELSHIPSLTVERDEFKALHSSLHKDLTEV